MGEFQGRRVLVVGLGGSGVAAAEALLAEGAIVSVSEHQEEGSTMPPDGALEGATVHFGGHREEHLDGIDLAIVSPGVPEHAPVIRWLLERDIPVWSELELGARLTQAPLVVITGTNGKSTTTEMVASCMRASGVQAMACGNIGVPFTAAARLGMDAYAVEASSFQLRFIHTLAPQVSVLLNIADDHLDWHGSFDAYAAAKARIFEFQTPSDTHVGYADDAAAAAISRTALATKRWFTLGEPSTDEVGFIGDELIAVNGDEKVSLGVPASAHRGFRADAAAAAQACLAFGLAPEAIRTGLAALKPMAHRGELVGTIGGVGFIDDSKATNPHAALASLDGRHDVVLIAGGLSKGVALDPLAQAADVITAVVAIGEAAQEIEDLFSGIRPVYRAQSLDQAVEVAAGVAVPSGTVLLAPGCASQDMFLDYEERGDRFAAAVHRLKTGAVAGG